jgi:hypothetical protein
MTKKSGGMLVQQTTVDHDRALEQPPAENIKPVTVMSARRA